MKGFVEDIATVVIRNANVRQVLYTAQHSPLVIMSLKPGEGIGIKVAGLDRLFPLQEGVSEAVIDACPVASAPGWPFSSRPEQNTT